jgi:hypothetical protein
MKNLLVLVLLVSFSVGINAQSSRNIEENQFKIKLVNPGVEYEVGVGTDKIINLGLGL